MSYKVEVIADSSGKWCGNGLRLETREQAEIYGHDIYWRWQEVRAVRVVESEDAVNYAIVDDGNYKKAVRLDTAK